MFIVPSTHFCLFRSFRDIQIVHDWEDPRCPFVYFTTNLLQANWIAFLQHMKVFSHLTGVLPSTHRGKGPEINILKTLTTRPWRSLYLSIFLFILLQPLSMIKKPWITMYLRVFVIMNQLQGGFCTRRSLTCREYYSP